MSDAMLPKECLAEWKQTLAEAEQGLGVPAWMTQQECMDYAKGQIAKLELMIARNGNYWQMVWPIRT
jgi:hypothetical protein